MSKYTTQPDSDADKLIEQDLSIIREHIVETFGPYVQAILLTGGFGRGEGAVVKENGSYRPINDYDIVIVTKRAIPGELLATLDGLRKRLDVQVHVKQVDLLLANQFTFMLPSPTIKRYEISNGHNVFYGSLRHKIQSIPARWVPLSEGTKYFRNRCGGLLVARLLLDGCGVFSESQRLELAALEVNKAFLVLGDAYLIENHVYHFSYRRRKQIFMERYESYDSAREVADLYIRACEEKLEPHFKGLSRKNISRDWFTAAEYLERMFLRFEGKRFNTHFNAIDDYREYQLPNFSGIRGVLSSFASLLNREDSPGTASMRTAAFLLLRAYREPKVDSFAKVAKMLGLDFSPELSWADLTKKFLLCWHPGGIVFDITKEANRPND